MDVQAISTLISTVGFPIFVAVWMLYKSSKDSEALKDAVNELKTAITILSERLSDNADDGE